MSEIFVCPECGYEDWTTSLNSLPGLVITLHTGETSGPKCIACLLRWLEQIPTMIPTGRQKLLRENNHEDDGKTAIEFTEEMANEFLSRARSRMELDTMRGGRR